MYLYSWTQSTFVSEGWTKERVKGATGSFQAQIYIFSFLPRTTDNLAKVVVVFYNIYGGTFHIPRSDITVVFHVSLGSNNGDLGLGDSVFDARWNLPDYTLRAISANDT